MKHFVLLLCVLSSVGCDDPKPKPETSPTEPAPTEKEPAAEKTAPIAIQTATEFTLTGVGDLKVGHVIDRPKVSDAFGATDVVLKEEMAEGEIVGQMFVVKQDGKLIARAKLAEQSKKLAVLEILGPLVGPDGIKPGVSTFEQIAEKVDVRTCMGGAEEYAEHVFCNTKYPSLRLLFASSIATTERHFDLEKAKKTLKGKRLVSAILSN